MPPILLDVLLVALLLFFTLRGAKKGFVLTLCSLVAVVVAFLGANLLADAMAPKVAEAIQPKLETVIEESLTEALRKTEFTAPGGDVATSAEEIPLAGVLEVLRENELYRQFLGGIEDALNEGAAATAASAASRVAAAVAAQLARGIIFLIGFVVVLLVWTLLSHALDLVAKLPVLNTLNSGLGGVVGLVKGVAIACVAVWALYSLSGYVSAEMMEQTFLFKFLALHSPLELLMMKDLAGLAEPS